jgi:excisionase family DNA binding protein
MKPKLLTVAQAAQLKGVSRTAIYNAILARRLPHRKVLGHLAVREADVLAWTPNPRSGRRKGARLSAEAKARISEANKQHWERRKNHPAQLPPDS